MKPVYVHILCGYSGYHEDACEWNVRAYASRERALADAEKAQQRARMLAEWRDWQGLDLHNSDDPKKPKIAGRIDPMLDAYRLNSNITYSVDTLLLCKDTAK